ncbi:MAG TPA: DUF1028 domain-containing protein [Vicinamibacteria bacterium]|nr:DUF1028 domain-containing protein [Vicinamibacteria bacterium]
MRRRATLPIAAFGLLAATARAEAPQPSTFSIVAADPEAGELGVAVASRFFSVGSVVPWAHAGVGAAATQASANTSWGARGLELLARGVSPGEAVTILTRGDEGRDRRQFGLVAADGASATFTGPGCTAWAGGRSGPGYAVQGNILAGEAVVTAMEKGFLETRGQPLAQRLFAALEAGDARGGDSRGRQSASLLVVREKGGFNGFGDRAIDVRVDDHPDPIRELGRLARMGLVNDRWNQGWTAYRQKRHADALRFQRETARLAEGVPEMLPEVLYDYAVILAANGETPAARAALDRALALNPKLKAQADADADLEPLRSADRR